MPDLHDVLDAAAPQVGDLDLAAVRARADRVRQADLARRRRTFTGLGVGLVALLGGLGVTALTAGQDPVGVADGPAAPVASPEVRPTAPSSALLIPTPTDPASPCLDDLLDTGQGQVYLVQPGDTLSSIAEAVYGDPTLFGLIAEANGLTGTAPMLVGQPLTIPDLPPGAAPAERAEPPISAVAVDDDITAALRAESAAHGWQVRPDEPGAVIADGPAGAVRISQIVLADGQSPSDLIAAAVANGAGEVPIPDGTSAAFTNPVATGQLLVPLTGDRVIAIQGVEDLAGRLDHELPPLIDWLAAVREALG